MGWQKNKKKRERLHRQRLQKARRGGYAATGDGPVPAAYAKGYQTRGLSMHERAELAAQRAERAEQAKQAIQANPAASPLAQGLPGAPVANPSEVLAGTPTAAQEAAAPGSGADASTLPQVELFERPHETHQDARLARRAIMRSWEPEPRATQAILTKAAMMALRDEAKLHEVIAVGKLHLDAHGKIMTEEHHNDRMGYYEAVQDFRRQTSDIPAMPLTINQSGGNIAIFLPHNERDELAEEPAMLPEDRP